MAAQPTTPTPDLHVPEHPVRIVTASALFDGHDASINIMRRIMQAQGAEVVHLGHNRSVQEVVDGLPRIAAAAERLAASGIPPSVQHNDLHLGNAFRRPGGAIAFIDLGDALWTHPLTTARIPVWIIRNRFGLAADSPEVRRAVDAYLDPWTDRWDRSTLRDLLADAERISCLHRAESWRRLQADVPVTRVDEPFLRSVPEWLVDAAAPDPYASAIAR